MKEKLLHTFMILAYKESPYLEKCILSLQEQTLRSEILISTSTPSEFLKNISENYKIPILVNDEKKGIASDWSFALKQGKTKYITLAHQDDVYVPQYVEQCLTAAERVPSNLITFTDYCEQFNGKLRSHNALLLIKRIMLFPYYIFKKNLSSPLLKRLMLSPGNPICCPTVMYNMDNIGQFEFNTSFLMNLDWELWLRFASMNGDFIYIQHRLLIRRVHKQSETTQTLTNNQRQTEDKLLLDKLLPTAIAKIVSKAYSIAYKSNG